MSQKITVNVPHSLGREDARTRIDSGFAKVQEQIAGKSVDVTQEWTGDTMAFTAAVMGQSIAGQLHVHDEEVRIELDLPWFLAKLAGTVKEKLTRSTQVLLDKK